MYCLFVLAGGNSRDRNNVPRDCCEFHRRNHAMRIISLYFFSADYYGKLRAPFSSLAPSLFFSRNLERLVTRRDITRGAGRKKLSGRRPAITSQPRRAVAALPLALKLGQISFAHVSFNFKTRYSRVSQPPASDSFDPDFFRAVHHPEISRALLLLTKSF